MLYIALTVAFMLFCFNVFNLKHLNDGIKVKEHTTAISIVTYNDSANESLIMEKDIER